MSNFTKWHLTREIFRILLVFSQFFWNLTFIFSGPYKKFSLVVLQITNYIYSPWKNVKNIAIFFKLFWYKVFVHWKLKLLNFLVDSVFKRGWKTRNSAIQIVLQQFCKTSCTKFPVALFTFTAVCYTAVFSVVTQRSSPVGRSIEHRT